MRRAEIDTIAERVLGATLRAAGFEAAKVEEGQNHAGEDALFITVRFRPGSGITPGLATADSIVALRSEFEKVGELRFPYLNYDYPDDPAPFEAVE